MKINGNAASPGLSPAALLNITAPEGSAITMTDGSLTLQKTGGTALFRLPHTGEWTVRAEQNGKSVQQTVTAAVPVTHLNYGPTASTEAKNGVTYGVGIGTLTPESLSAYAQAISDNADITGETAEVYIDHEDTHIKISTGDTVSIVVSGAAYEFIVLGFNHDALADPAAYGAETATGHAGLTLQMRHCLAAKYSMSKPTEVTNAGGWAGCQLRGTLQSTILGTMPAAWRNVMKSVQKLSSAGSGGTGIARSTDSLFLLAEIEVYGRLIRSFAGEGSQYAWYAAGNTKEKKVGTNSSIWWERSPVSTTGFGDVDVTGNYTAYNSNVAHGVAFAFCL